MDAARTSARRAAAAAVAAVAALACVLAALVAAGADGASKLRPVSGPLKVAVGIADQKSWIFGDARLHELGLRYARRSVPWDALRFRDQRRELDAWMNGVRMIGAEPLITLAQSKRRPDRPYRAPGVREVERQFRRFLDRYPDVKTYSTWNEANMCGAGLCQRPDLVAGYYRAMRRSCPDCQVLAADLLDLPNMVGWVRAFRRHAGVEPRLWGLHNYIDANRGETARTAALLREVRGEVWLTEVGGIVARRTGSRIKLPQGKAHAARATQFIFDRIARLDARITRIYFYHWRSSTRRDSWDSAFIAADGGRRPSLRVLQRALRNMRADL
ncbi:MAG TPA: hypothetical protein VM299_02770 [Solirubrobacteraceae bacterium]|nr:hypothetical protein [Solirubrobacteraceae bacterium]